MTIINPKTNFPTDVEFYAIISVFPDRVIAKVKCLHCDGKISIELNVPKGVRADRIHPEWVKQRVLTVAKERHTCLYKASMWGDKNIINKIGADIVRGWEKLKEFQFRSNREGRA